MTLKYNEQGQPYEDPIDENKKLKDKLRIAEGELSIIKGIGMNSPEMRAAQARIKELDNSLSIALNINDKYQRENKDLGEKCVKAGLAMIELNAKYEVSIKEIDRLSEENTNIKTMTDDGKNTSNSC